MTGPRDSERSVTFRSELREFLAANPPPAGTGFDVELDWQQTLAADGWVAPHWPERFGGRSATLADYAIYVTELADAGAPQVANRVGVSHAGPTLLEHGNDDQRSRWLPPILSGDEIWCQLFSEPDAGSDLAAVSTRAERDGDGWRVSGQKVWTSYADRAAFGILLARTGTAAERHRGLSFFVFDLSVPGVEIRPLRQFTGEVEFFEVFFDGARLEDEALVGREGDGWRIATTTLAHERGVGFPLKEQVVLRRLLDEKLAAGARGALGRQQLAHIYTQSEIFRYLNLRTLERLATGADAGAETSLAKLAWSDLAQSTHAYGVPVVSDTSYADAPWRDFLWSRSNTIAGGTSEIQKNIIGERLLGLPREPRPPVHDPATGGQST